VQAWGWPHLHAFECEGVDVGVGACLFGVWFMWMGLYSILLCMFKPKLQRSSFCLSGKSCMLNNSSRMNDIKAFLFLTHTCMYPGICRFLAPSLLMSSTQKAQQIHGLKLNSPKDASS